MEVVAKAQSIKISPRKVRLVAELIKNISTQEAIDMLSITRKKSSKTLGKIIQSAVANAIHNARLKKDGLFIKRIDVTEGSALKRYHPSSRGRTHPYKKRTSHITIVIGEK